MHSITLIQLEHQRIKSQATSQGIMSPCWVMPERTQVQLATVMGLSLASFINMRRLGSLNTSSMRSLQHQSDQLSASNTFTFYSVPTISPKQPMHIKMEEILWKGSIFTIQYIYLTISNWRKRFSNFVYIRFNDTAVNIYYICFTWISC